MKLTQILALTALFMAPLAPAVAQDSEIVFAQEAGEATLSDFKWTARVLMVFADTPLDPNFREQMLLLADRPDALIERDVVVLTDTDPDARNPIRLELRPRGFALVIVDKDSRVMLRKPSPWDVREITRAIDKTPLRQQEIESGL
ncbi:DUF4174 domain-containing protein [Celeribacter litoreus]|uniref:DUF4174 domain-containing protein n=1 Tax=Celeribacter litoreus TaxID=2876714 RepID=UPI001CCC8345|nr:DUF4174 domain-containing protein [Celeribacter litoreus]MCA0042970.1 DUF4174 domain-containing protein [Celeribacter litoreus]